MLIKKKNVYNYYKILSVVLFIISVTIFALDTVGIGHDFFNGLAASFLLLSIILFIVLIIKRKDNEFKNDLDHFSADERIKSQYKEIHSIMNHITLILLVVMLILSVFYKFPFHIGGTVILWVQIIGISAIWFYNKRKSLVE